MKTKSVKVSREKRGVKTSSVEEHEEESNLEMAENSENVDSKTKKGNAKVKSTGVQKSKKTSVTEDSKDLDEKESNGLHEEAKEESEEEIKSSDVPVAETKGRKKKPALETENGSASKSTSKSNTVEEDSHDNEPDSTAGKKVRGKRQNKKEAVKDSTLDNVNVSDTNTESEPIEKDLSNGNENKSVPTKGKRGLKGKATEKETDSVAEKDNVDEVLNDAEESNMENKGRRVGRGKSKQKVDGDILDEELENDDLSVVNSGRSSRRKAISEPVKKSDSKDRPNTKQGRKKETKDDVKCVPSNDNTVKTLDPIKEESEDDTPQNTQDKIKSKPETSNKRNLSKRKANADGGEDVKTAKSSRTNKHHSVKESTEDEELHGDNSEVSSKVAENEENTKTVAEEKKSGRSEKDQVVSDADNETGEEKTSARGRKRTAAGASSKTSDDSKKSKGAKESKNEDSSFADAIIDPEAKNSSGSKWNLKISTWNVSGLRAWIGKDGLKYLEKENPDIFVMQETKCSDDKLPAAANVEGYHRYWCASKLQAGHSGVALFSKKKPITVTYGFGKDDDPEGRVITAEYDSYYVINAYVPNSGRGLKNLTNRMKWDEEFRAYLKSLDSKKPIILCGDMNVSHKEIDLANPKTNTKNAGFTPEERAEMDKHLEAGFFDSFRKLYPDKRGVYTFWTYMGAARKKNVGWRLDYFLLSDRLESALCDVVTRSQVYGSDHCPLVLYMSI